MDRRVENQMDLIQKFSDNKSNEFTVQDLDEICIEFNYMYNRLQMSKNEQFSVFEFQEFIRHLREKDFPAAQKSLEGALREYKLVGKLYDRLEQKQDEANDVRTQLSHGSVERNTDKGEELSILNAERDNDPTIDYTESRYTPDSEVKTGDILGTDAKGNSSQKVNLEEGNEHYLPANATAKETNRESSGESRQNVERMSKELGEDGNEKHKLLDSLHGPNENINFIQTETTDKDARTFNSNLSSRSKDPSLKEKAHDENEKNHTHSNVSDRKRDRMRISSSESTVPHSFGKASTPGSATHTITEPGYSSDTGTAPKKGIDKKPDVETHGSRDLLRRSEEASLLLHQGNPNIADLSDTNRPTNLAERFSELYSNEYTEAFELLQKQGQEEEKIVYDLLRIVRYTYQYCRQRASEELSKRMHNVLQEQKASREFTVHDKDKEEAINKGLAAKKLKIDAPYLKNEVRDTFMQKNFWKLIREKIDPTHNDLVTYGSKCVDIVWFMCVQDPPISMSWVENGDTFDTSLYRAYTKSGTKVDFCVWPLVLLADNGPVLSKGIAQGK